MTNTLHDPSVDLPVRHERDARGVHVLTLNQPKSFNVLSESMLSELQRQLDLIVADEGARVLADV